MKKLLLAILLMLSVLTSCRGNEIVLPAEETYTIQSTEGVDGYYVERASFISTNIDLQIYMFRSREEFEKAAHEKGMFDKIGKHRQIMGFTSYSSISNKCVMYIYDPAFFYGPEYIGHELVHCIYGDFHPNQPKEEN